MRKMLVVYHTLTGGSLQMAQAAMRGATAGDSVNALLVKAVDAEPEHLMDADGYLFVCPENLAGMAGLMKDFFDRCYYPVFDRLHGRAYATLICAGSDGSNAARQIERIATGWRLKAIAAPLIICTHSQTPNTILAPKQLKTSDLARCEEVGATLASGLALGIY